MLVSTPLHTDEWEAALAPHPDRAYTKYPIRGLRGGFRIGFEPGVPLRSAPSNLPSSKLQPKLLSYY